MQAIVVVGLDIAKSVFQVHGVNAHGDVIVRRQLKRRYVVAFFKKLPSCLVGIEACATSHHWSRELRALGHTVRLIPPAYVKPYVKRQKNDAADAEAICEAVQRPSMRFVPIKDVEQQAVLALAQKRHNIKINSAIVRGMMDQQEQLWRVRVRAMEPGRDELESRVVTKDELETLRKTNVNIEKQ